MANYRIWAPWRLTYVKDAQKDTDEGCIFCSKPSEDDDEVRGGGDGPAFEPVGPAEPAGGDVFEDAGDASVLEIVDEDLQDALDRRGVGLDDDAGLAHACRLIHGSSPP